MDSHLYNSFVDYVPGGAKTVFVLVDLLTGIVLHRICLEFSKHELKRQTLEVASYSPKAKHLLITINVFIYAIPLAVKLRERPLFQLYVVMAIISIFKSYPSYADTALYLSLLPLWKHVFGYLRNGLVVTVMYSVVAVVAPILWHLWIYSASANANFYFAITLVFSTAQIFLLTDLMFAFLRYEYDLHHGIEHYLANGKKTVVVLQ
nr:hypothetical protein BaRGS_004883 [Batillaria attramentaria]